MAKSGPPHDYTWAFEWMIFYNFEWLEKKDNEKIIFSKM
jgi:hypothetical protein